MQHNHSPDPYLRFQNDPAPVWVFDFANHRMLWANDAALSFWKAASYDEFVHKDYSDDSRSARERIRQSVNLAKHDEWSRESWTLFPGGQPVTVVIDARLVEHADGNTAILYKIAETLAFAQADPDGLRMLLTARATTVAVSIFDREGRLISENPAGLALRLATPDWTEPARHLASRHGDAKRANETIKSVERDEIVTFEAQVSGESGVKVFTVTAQRVRDPVTGDFAIQITEEDITEKAELAASLAEINKTLEQRVAERSRDLEETNARLKAEIEKRKQAQLQVERERDFFAQVQEVVPIAIFYKDSTGKYVECNKMWCDQLGRTRDNIIGYSCSDIQDSEIGNLETSSDEILLQNGEGGRFPMKLVHSDGTARSVINCKAPIKRWDGETWIVGAVLDVTEKEAIEQNLRQREAVLQEATKATNTAFVVYDKETRKVDYSSESYKNLVCASDQLFDEILDNVDNRFKLIPEPYSEEVRSLVENAERADGPFEFTFEVKDDSDEERSINARGHPIPNFELGASKRVTIIQDVTDAVAIEKRLRQRQKLEAIGQLTGGIAHDFNNLLAVVQGNVELMQASQSFADDLVQEVINACQRGAELTRNLLAYARKQTLKSEPTDLRQRANSIESILQRTLGEDIDLKVKYQKDLWVAKVDPGQFDDALLNLALNARDACRNGGNVSIDIRNAHISESSPAVLSKEITPNDYIVMSVTDNGKGMSSDVLEKATDPFFTTKDVGQGSGLGLSMVYGFAKQSGGNLSIYSEVDHGTTVRLYLPRYHEAAATIELEEQEPFIPMGRGETVVVVEDDPAVSRVVERTLESLNYKVLTFEKGQLCVDYLRNGGEMDVLLTDVILPGGMGGPELAEIVRAELTEPRILFMSGYPAEAAKKNGFIGSNSVLLNKPIMRAELAVAIDEIMKRES